ncbi:MAG: FkbM family methyltransferase, partial [Kangiellaceae bacterium]|nr:FkbM family methyltransferase [Kangiellaceae bacterium]
MKLKKLLSAIKHKLITRDKALETSTLCGLTLKTVPGTLRKNTDQDDAWFFELCKHHHIIFDIGCNVGYTALLAAIQNPNCHLVLVDPNPKALNQAQLNLIYNNLGFRAQYFCGFVSDKQDETIKFYTLGSGAAGSMYSSHAETAAVVNAFSYVKTVTLDYLHEFYRLLPDLVKIDVEGAETLVMKGASYMAKKSQCSFFVEMHNVENLGMKEAGQLMLNWCKSNDYKAWY